MMFELGGALDTSVPYLANLHGVEAVPLASVELFVEIDNELAVDKVEEGVAYVAVVLLYSLFTL